MVPKSIKFILDTLRGFVAGTPPPIPDVCREDIPDITDLVRTNRLEPVFGKYLAEAPPEYDVLRPLISECESAYKKCLLHGCNHLHAGATLWRQLEDAAIPCIAYKGPFHGEMLYGDTGMRYFADIDLLVHPDQAEQARRLAQAHGWTLRNPYVPLSFYRRHHLHWPLRNEQTDVLCDLHWFVDHPYKLYRINYHAIFDHSQLVSHNGFTWRYPAPDDLLLLACVNLIKECRNRVTDIFEQTGDRPILQNGILRYWLDMALILQRYGTAIDWEYILQSAREWNIVYAMNAALYGAIKLFHTYIPQNVQDHMLTEGRTHTPPSCILSAIQKSGAATAVGHMGGFKPESLEDAFHFLLPPPDYFDDRPGWTLTCRRAGHFLHASMRLGTALVDVARCKLIYQSRKKRGYVPDVQLTGETPS
ncbi:MAG: hypothetical protein EOM20_10310 [Spartobacteria bacterium]|nr:hypothetical protein [Spartobacteria bacterium]